MEAAKALQELTELGVYVRITNQMPKPKGEGIEYVSLYKINLAHNGIEVATFMGDCVATELTRALEWYKQTKHARP